MFDRLLHLFRTTHNRILLEEALTICEIQECWLMGVLTCAYASSIFEDDLDLVLSRIRFYRKLRLFEKAHDICTKYIDFYNDDRRVKTLVEIQCKLQQQHPWLEDRFVHYPDQLVKRITQASGKSTLDAPDASTVKTVKTVTFTMTTCKRVDLFQKTVNSFIHCCLDLDKIGRWIVVDDNSSPEDRSKMETLYPFMEFHWKSPGEKGHAESMNIILSLVTTPYIFHMEDDFKFYKKDAYISKCTRILNSDPGIGQCLVIKNYAETCRDWSISGDSPRTTGRGVLYYMHTYDRQRRARPYRNCCYWPHYSLRPSLLKRSALRKVGKYDTGASHFEMEYAYRYSRHYTSAFMKSI
jgi:hypothetical protein